MAKKSQWAQIGKRKLELSNLDKVLFPEDNIVKAEVVEYLRVHLKPSKANGLEKDSDILIDQMVAIDNKRLVRRLGKVTHSELDLTVENISIILDFVN